MKISSWYLPSTLHCEILFARTKVNRSAIANNTKDQLLLWHLNRNKLFWNKSWKTWQGLLFRRHPPPVNVNVKTIVKMKMMKIPADGRIMVITWETTATNRCWTPRAIATWEQSSSKEGEHLPPFKTSGSSYHCWWKVYSRDRGKQEIIDKDLEKDKDKDRRSQTKALTVTKWSDSPTHLQKQVSRGT